METCVEMAMASMIPTSTVCGLSFILEYFPLYQEHETLMTLQMEKVKENVGERSARQAHGGADQEITVFKFIISAY